VARYNCWLLAVVSATLVLAGCDEFPARQRPQNPQPPRVPELPSCGGADDSDGDCVPNQADRCRATAAGQAVWTSGEWAGCAAGQYRDADQLPGSDAAGAHDAGSKPGPTPPPPDASPPKPPPNPGVTLTAQEKDLVDSINQARQKLGLNTLTVEPLLMCAAKLMISSGGCDHYAGGTWSDRAQKCGMGSQAAWYVNEIIAQGQMDGAECVYSWKGSSGHWAGLTHAKAKTIGVGVRPSDHCWVAMFDCCIMGSGQ